MDYMLQIDFLADMKPYYGLQKRMPIFSIWMMSECLRSIREKGTTRGPIKGNHLVIQKEKIPKMFGILCKRSGMYPYGIFQM